MYQTQWFANKNVFKWLEVGPMGRDKKISNKTKKKKNTVWTTFLLENCTSNSVKWGEITLEIKVLKTTNWY